MADNQPSKEAVSRRKMLSAVSTVVAAGAGLGTASGRRREHGSHRAFKKAVAEANEIREQTDSQKAWEQRLQEHGYEPTSKKMVFDAQTGTPIESKAQAQELRKEWMEFDISLVMSCYARSDILYADFSWKYHSSCENDWRGPALCTGIGESPMDFAGLYYYPDWFTLDPSTNDMDELTYTYPSSHVTYKDGSDQGDGLLWEVDDAAITPDDGGWDGSQTSRASAGMYVKPINDYDPIERRIFAEYAHTNGHLGVDSVGLTYPEGITLNVSHTVEKSVWDTNNDNERLMVRENDQTLNCTPYY